MRLPRLAALLVLSLHAGCAEAQTPAATSTAATASVPADTVRARAVASRARGAEGAPIEILVFSDFQCPFCREFEQRTMAALDSAYLQTGVARLVFYNLPLPNHPNALSAAEAALCAGAQDAFWPMHDRLFADQAEWSAAELPAQHYRRYAGELSLDAAAFQRCTEEDLVAPILVQDVMMAAGSGVRGTPLFAIVREPRAGEQPQDAQRVLSGAQPFEEFQRAIEELLAK